ncbi:MAG: FmdB family transcriptional regulator [Propionibacterium sp.]|nr:FmdB family transcriptional regulator [Propionibacterium sp.]
MPTYAYACTQCSHTFDAVQSFSEPSLTDCPQCQGALRKQYGSIGVTFNGSGFYRTDSRSGSSTAKDSAPAKSSSESGSGAKSTTSTSSKTEAKASPAPSGS